MVDRLGGMLDAVAETACAMFEAVIENSDEHISVAEYRQLIETWNGRPTDPDEVFARLDTDGTARCPG